MWRKLRQFLWLIPVLLLFAAVGTYVAFRVGHLSTEPELVRRTTLENSVWRGYLHGGGAWRNLPFKITADEESDVKRCLAVGSELNSTHNGRSRFLDDAARKELEAVLAKRPGFFYAEYLLGVWHTKNGDAAAGQRYHEQAFEHAPVVLVQTYLFPDGRPLVGANVRWFEIECNRVQKGSIDPSLKLMFYDLVTDAQGQMAVPVYDTVYRHTTVSHPTAPPQELKTNYPTLGWFEPTSKRSLLPAATVEIVVKPGQSK